MRDLWHVLLSFLVYHPPKQALGSDSHESDLLGSDPRKPTKNGAGDQARVQFQVKFHGEKLAGSFRGGLWGQCNHITQLSPSGRRELWDLYPQCGQSLANDCGALLVFPALQAKEGLAA